MAITKVINDVIRVAADGSTSSVPQWQVYNHHSAVVLSGAASEPSNLVSMPQPFWTRADNGWGSWSGSFRQVIPFSPSTWSLQYHLINTHRKGDAYDGKVSPLHMCPCTPQRDIDIAAGTIDGISWRHECIGMLAAEANPACSLASFSGGEACCAVDGTFVIDTSVECATLPYSLNCTEQPAERFFFESTVYYEDATPTTHLLNTGPNGERIVKIGKPLAGTQPGLTVQKATAASGSDYEVLPCAEGTPADECTHTLTWEEPVMMYYFPENTLVLDESGDSTTEAATLNGTFRVIKAYPHVHTAILETTVRDARTNTTLCYMSRKNGRLVYGTSAQAKNERGYLIEQQSCDWSADDAPLLTTGTPLIMTMIYDAHKHYTGVMAQWYFDVDASIV